MRAIQVTRHGGPEALEAAEVDAPVPAEGQLLVAVTAAGVNFADLSRIAGTYSPAVELPFVPGSEVVGHTADGRRVVGLSFGGGGFAEQALVPADSAVEVPDGVSDEQALALLVQGLTAWHLLRGSARLRDGESVAVNAAAGGVGSLAVQLAREFGAGRVIAAASTSDKRRLTLDLGADASVDSDPTGYADRIRQANGAQGVDVVLDANGGAAITAGLDALAQFGRLVSYGDAAHQGRPSIDPAALAERNLSVSGFWLRPALSLPLGYREPLVELLGLTAQGRLRPLTGSRYPLVEAGRAFADLTARRTTGKVVLLVA
ncbi:NADPH:quinone oxidoreductase family protein [Kutzneria sp. 744]|uniref:quinone oxidoreductase family protein n=1 Tax=Kutzneria sp. (strain 744) TaxID=345341 RepID=UPI0003EEB8F2|nr:NADPH:quinone oxidoreductase family protein [Kutzneria sp. 744]EWM09944.1 quinone oxidoreductase [Kutzneria sp. 744]